MASKNPFLKIIALTLIVTFTFTNSIGYTDLPSSFSTALKNSEIYHMRANAEVHSGFQNVRSELRKAGIEIPQKLEIPEDDFRVQRTADSVQRAQNLNAERSTLTADAKSELRSFGLFEGRVPVTVKFTQSVSTGSAQTLQFKSVGKVGAYERILDIEIDPTDPARSASNIVLRFVEDGYSVRLFGTQPDNSTFIEFGIRANPKSSVAQIHFYPNFSRGIDAARKTAEELQALLNLQYFAPEIGVPAIYDIKSLQQLSFSPDFKTLTVKSSDGKTEKTYVRSELRTIYREDIERLIEGSFMGMIVGSGTGMALFVWGFSVRAAVLSGVAAGLITAAVVYAVRGHQHRAREAKKRALTGPVDDDSEGNRGSRSELRHKPDYKRFERFGITFKDQADQSVEVDFTNVPSNVSWVMDGIRPIEEKPIARKIDEIPSVKLQMDLKAMPLLSDGGDNSSVYLNVSHIDNANVPVAVKIFNEDFLKKLPKAADEIEKAQALDRLGTHPRFYGVVKNKKNIIIGYVMQLVIGELVNPLTVSFDDKEWSEILQRLDSIGLEPLPQDAVRTRAGNWVAIDAGGMETPVFDSDAEAKYQAFLNQLSGNADRADTGRSELRHVSFVTITQINFPNQLPAGITETDALVEIQRIVKEAKEKAPSSPVYIAGIGEGKFKGFTFRVETKDPGAPDLIEFDLSKLEENGAGEKRPIVYVTGTAALTRSELRQDEDIDVPASIDWGLEKKIVISPRDEVAQLPIVGAISMDGRYGPLYQAMKIIDQLIEVLGARRSRVGKYQPDTVEPGRFTVETPAAVARVFQGVANSAAYATQGTKEDLYRLAQLIEESGENLSVEDLFVSSITLSLIRQDLLLSSAHDPFLLVDLVDIITKGDDSAKSELRQQVVQDEVNAAVIRLWDEYIKQSGIHFDHLSKSAFIGTLNAESIAHEIEANAGIRQVQVTDEQVRAGIEFFVESQRGESAKRAAIFSRSELRKDDVDRMYQLAIDLTERARQVLIHRLSEDFNNDESNALQNVLFPRIQEFHELFERNARYNDRATNESLEIHVQNLRNLASSMLAHDVITQNTANTSTEELITQISISIRDAADFLGRLIKKSELKPTNRGGVQAQFDQFVNNVGITSAKSELRTSLFSEADFASIATNVLAPNEAARVIEAVQAGKSQLAFPGRDDRELAIDTVLNIFTRVNSNVTLGSILTRDLIFSETDLNGQAMLWALPIIAANTSDPIALVADSAGRLAIQEALKGIQADHIVIAEDYREARFELRKMGAKEFRIIASENERGSADLLTRRYADQVVFVARKNIGALFKVFGLDKVAQGLTLELNAKLAVLRSA